MHVKSIKVRSSHFGVSGRYSNTSTYAPPTYANLEFGDFQFSPIRLLLEGEIIGKIGEIDNSLSIEEFADLPRLINLEVNGDDIQELLDSHNQKTTVDELIEMHEQKQDIEEV
ncbi:hypothetical protein TNCV_3701691 [Trichonephila clavipes]|nr:hypothetical protein TNCV_3701691 [Trichonephila clavipes]